MNDSILLSEEHGLNPSLETCLLCEKDLGIILFGKLKDDKKAPTKICLGHLCDDCLKKLKDNKERIFYKVDDNGYILAYIILKDEYFTSDFLKILGNKVDIYLPEHTFEVLKEQLNLSENQ